MTKPLFDVIRQIAGRGLTQAEVDAVNAALGPIQSHALTTPASFYAGVRKVTGPLDGDQVTIIDDLLEAAKHWQVSWLAYGLATAWHEARMKPIEEWGKGAGRPYGKPGKHGQPAYGRGLVQLTWDYNYAKADEELNLGGALIRNYALALHPDIATQILVRGMEAGWFTGKKLADYLPARLGTVEQFRGARRIINGTDKADLIAGHALKFQEALILGGWS